MIANGNRGRRRGAVVGPSLLLALLLAACSSTTFRSTWRAPGAAPVRLVGQRIAAVFMSDDDGARHVAEDALARDLSRRGVSGVPGYEILSSREDLDENVARQKFTDAHVDGVVMMRLVGSRQQATVVPGYPGPSPWGVWGYGWRAAYTPGYLRSETLVSVETMVYSLHRDGILWAGLSETVNPNRVDSFVTEIAQAVADEMAREGLLAK